MADKSIADRINLRELEVFVSICENGSVSMAGQRGGLTQPAVSQVLRRLETRVGKILVDRSTRPLRVTADGNELLRSARQLLDTAHEVISKLDDGNVDRRISLRLGLIESLTVPFVPCLISALGTSFEHFSVTAGSNLTLRESFLERRIDFAITTEAMHDLSKVEVHPILDEPFILLMPGGLAPAVSMEDVIEICETLPLVRFGARSAAGSVIEAQLRRMRLPITDAFELDASDSVIGMVAAGYGWAIVNPLSLLRCWSSIDRVQMLRFPGPAFSRKLYLVSRHLELGQFPQHLAAKSRAVIANEYIRHILARAPWLSDSLRIIDDVAP